MWYSDAPVVILDIRRKADYDIGHSIKSLSFPLAGLETNSAGADLFGDANAVLATCNSLDQWLKGTRLSQFLLGASKTRQKVIVVCYDGFASQLACSAIRAENVEAFSVRGGFPGLSS